MILRIVPFLLIVIPIIGFFYTPEPPGDIQSDGRAAIANLAFLLFTLPWWAKLLSIFIGVSWLASGENKSED
jgi:hypothetical protein